jgi:hypothetical protein
MVPIDLALFDARDRALPGREQATLNELCRSIVEALRQPPLSTVDNVLRWPLERRRATSPPIKVNFDILYQQVKAPPSAPHKCVPASPRNDPWDIAEEQLADMMYSLARTEPRNCCSYPFTAKEGGPFSGDFVNRVLQSRH